jgi:hypothetical protein
MPRSRPIDPMKHQPAPQTLDWTTNEGFATGKGATVQEFVAVVGNSRYVIDVAPWGEGRFVIDGREIASTDRAKDGQQAFKNLSALAERYLRGERSEAIAAYPGREGETPRR